MPFRSLGSPTGTSTIGVITRLSGVSSHNHIREYISAQIVGLVCFTSMIVLQRIFDICAEELAVYLGMDFEGFIVVTVSKLVLYTSLTSGVCSLTYSVQCHRSNTGNYIVAQVRVRFECHFADQVGVLIMSRPDCDFFSPLLLVRWATAPCRMILLRGNSMVGVMLLHLLLVPGTEFFIRGVETYELILHPLDASINTSLLMVGYVSFFPLTTSST